MPFNTNNKIQLVDASGDPVVLGSGTVTTETLRVTMASDDVLLTAMNTNLADIETLLTGIDADTNAIKTSIQILDDWDDSNYANVNINLAGSDAPTGGGAESGALRVTLANDSTGVISIDDGGGSITIDGVLSTSYTYVLGSNSYLEGTTNGVPVGAVRNDTLASLANTDNEIAPFQVDAQGALYTTHGITGATSSKNTAVGTGIEDLHDSDVACKRVDMMASPDNTGYIWVGGANTAVGIGIRLAPGDFYSVDCDNTDDIQVVATVANEDISYTIFT